MTNVNKSLALLQTELDSELNRKWIESALKENASSFKASIVEVFNELGLESMNPNDLIKECMKAATLNLPISKSIGQAYIVPYKGKPQFQIGYKGLIQLAIRTGQYETINADAVYKGEYRTTDRMKGTFDLNGKRESDEVIGYFAHIELKNGFSKTLYKTRDEVLKHAKKYSKSFNSNSDFNIWKSDEVAMGKKTVLKMLLSVYGPVSIDMQKAFEDDVQDEINQNANVQEMDFQTISSTPKKEKKEQKPINIEVKTTEVPTTEVNSDKPKTRLF